MDLTINFVLVDEGMIEEAIRFERSVFEECDTDESGCVTWEEVVKCMGEFDYPPPSKEDFDDMDADEDGCVTFDEWMAWQDGKILPYIEH